MPAEGHVLITILTICSSCVAVRTNEYHRVKILLHPAGLWGVINNAGIAKIGPIEWQTIEEYKQVADVNLWGLIEVTKVFLPLIKKERGRIVNIASIGGE